MKTQRDARSVAATTLLAPVAWGTTYVTITEFLPQNRPLLVAALRVLPAGSILVAASAARNRRTVLPSSWTATLLLSACNFGVFFPLLIVAVYRLPGGVAAAMGGTQPLLVAALSSRLLGERPRRRSLAVGAVAVLGVSLVVVRPSAQTDLVGVLAAVGANVSFACGVVLTKRFGRPENQLAAAGWQLLLAGAVLVPVAIAIEGTPPALTGRNVVGFGYLSLIGTAVAFVLWFNGVRQLPSSAPPLLGLASPITGAAIGWIALHQSLSVAQLIGFALTIGSIGYGGLVSSTVTAQTGTTQRAIPSRRR
jgi:probable blue pigment (indigoidine) exporter